MSGISRDAWQEALNELHAAPLENDPDAVSVAEFGELMGIGRYTAARRLAELLRHGKVERTTKRMRRVNGSIVVVPAYRLPKGSHVPNKPRRGR